MSNNKDEWDYVYHSLKGHIKFIHGNHDTINKITYYIDEYNMEDLGLAFIYRYNKKKHFYLSHYPTYTANFDDDKELPLINLFGHTHQKTKFFNENPYMYNVAWDAHHMPISIEQIINDINKKKENII